MCGYFKGLNYNVERPNILSDYLQNWISGKRPHYNGSSEILEDSSWGYIPDYIPRPVQAKLLAQPVNSNLHQYEYKNGEYIWLTRTDNQEAILLDNCTHIRFAYFENGKSKAVVTVEDGTFTNFNDIHPNLLGFKKMATVWAEKMKELLFPKI
jgi:hypothetical protein